MPGRFLDPFYWSGIFSVSAAKCSNSRRGCYLHRSIHTPQKSARDRAAPCAPNESWRARPWIYDLWWKCMACISCCSVLFLDTQQDPRHFSDSLHWYEKFMDFHWGITIYSFLASILLHISWYWLMCLDISSRFRVHLVSPYFRVGHLIFAVCFSYFIPIARPCFLDSGETTLDGIVHCHLIDYHQ